MSLGPGERVSARAPAGETEAFLDFFCCFAFLGEAAAAPLLTGSSASTSAELAGRFTPEFRRASLLLTACGGKFVPLLDALPRKLPSSPRLFFRLRFTAALLLLPSPSASCRHGLRSPPAPAVPARVPAAPPTAAPAGEAATDGPGTHPRPAARTLLTAGTQTIRVRARTHMTGLDRDL